jgi:hypothetical protein
MACSRSDTTPMKVRCDDAIQWGTSEKAYRYNYRGAIPGRSGGRNGSPRIRNTSELRDAPILRATFQASHLEEPAQDIH